MSFLSRRISTLVSFVVTSSLLVSSLIVLVLALLGASNVVSLYAFDQAVPSAVELSSVLLAAVVFGGLAATQRARSNIEVSLILDMLPVALQSFFRCISLFIATLIIGYVAYRLSILALKSYQTEEFASGLWGFPVYPVKIWCAVAIWIATLEFWRQSVVAFAALWRPGASPNKIDT